MKTLIMMKCIPAATIGSVVTSLIWWLAISVNPPVVTEKAISQNQAHPASDLHLKLQSTLDSGWTNDTNAILLYANDNRTNMRIFKFSDKETGKMCYVAKTHDSISIDCK